ncbi:class I SAM-dependent methyltransferase [Legionella cardiaca]|uniref:Methyltransferase domain-containing protein n=1 Tax=Legionella cardiaca TaxID=1071983 RepID=A0ABY8APF6_9GAMM|nr:class I SAM-dependent methyltransferase [Legionella cardiaca]WED42590.1 methyltransferase domain-containing protein [Legionella cardiaca]
MQIETMSNKEITKQSYQATAVEFANNVADLAPIASIEKFIKLLPPKAKIIDIGCGSGRDAKIFSNMGADVLGIDFCSNLIDIAKKNAPLSEFQVMDFETMNFPAASFDGAWSACSLGHSSKKILPDILKNIHLLLKENGYFYLALKKGSGESLDKDLRYEGDVKKFWAFFEEEELMNILQAAHFKILDFDTVEKKFTYQSHPALRIFCQKI